ncbi:MAG: restriction endonuclease [Candidatus Bathyarchaeota archaeon]|nr:restriction endonuclease [Candidatus Bathyarchaeota archaeon]
MSVECNLLISLLKFTKEKPVLVEDVKTTARLPLEVCWQLLQKMQKENLIYLTSESVEIDSANRLKIAVKAATLGADIQTISNLLGWQEFEEMTAIALKSNGYTVHNNLRFKHAGRRYEVDVVGCRKPLVICIDCKRWQHAIAASALRKIVEEQTERTQALADSLPNPKLELECTKWDNVKFMPAVLSLMPGAYKFYYEVPVVTVLQIQDFICQLPLHVESLKCFPKRFNTLS